MYNAYCEANTAMTLSSVQMEVKKFWRDRKETRDLMYSSPTKPGPGQNTERNRGRRQRKKDKKKSGSKETVAQVTGDDDKDKEIYCFRCGETTHRVKDCPKKGDLKCKAHPTSISHTDMACFYYRKAHGLPIMTRPCPDGRRTLHGVDQLLHPGMGPKIRSSQRPTKT